MRYRPHRYNTQFPINLQTPVGPQRSNVIDVNNTGARIEGVRGLDRGDKLQIDVLSHKVNAVVQWAAGGRAGVTFRPQLSNHQVDTLRKRTDGRSGAGRGRVGFQFQEMR